MIMEENSQGELILLIIFMQMFQHFKLVSLFLNSSMLQKTSSDIHYL